MKFKFLSLFLALALILGLGFVKPVEAAGYGTPFLTSITYMNVGDQEAQIVVDFYAEGATTVTRSYPVANLARGAAASLSVGSVFTTSFTGSAILSSSQPLVATMVQVPTGSTTVKNRPMSNGFSGGSTSVLIPTVLKNKFNSNTIFSVQNTGTGAANVTVTFIPSTDGTATTLSIPNLAVGAAKYVDMGTFTQAGGVFNGSVRITSGQEMVATAMELNLATDAVYAFEGVGSGAANTLYMPSAMCNFGPTRTSSSFAIQNTSDSTATNVSVTYVGVAGSSPVNTTINLGSLAPGAKVSSSGCGTAGSPIPATFLGAATVNSTAAPIAAIAKIFNSGNFGTAHLGASQGAQRLAAPYVRWSDRWYHYSNNPTVQQTNIAVQNVGGAALPVGSVVVNFVGANGQVLGSYSNTSALAVGAKFSVNPRMAGLTEFGYVPDGSGRPTSYGGGAIIQGPTGSQLAAVVRVGTSVSTGDVAEDYNAIPLQ